VFAFAVAVIEFDNVCKATSALPIDFEKVNIPTTAFQNF